MYFMEDAEGIISQFCESEVESDVNVTRKLLQKVLQLTSYQHDTSQLFPHVVKFLASSDLIVKKLAYWYLTQNSKDSRIILAINTLLKDCYDPNPMVRGLAIRTLGSLQHETVLPYAVQQVQQAISDTSSYVRRAAIMACVKIHAVEHDALRDSGLVDKLYSMIRDSDPVVVVNCIGGLEEILSTEGGIVINRKMANYLLNRLKMFTEWDLVTVLSLLSKYRPKTEEEVLDIMNIVDSYLKHNNMAVVMMALTFFVHLVRDMPHLKNEVFNRAKGQIFHCIGAGNAELTFILLEYVESVLDEHKESFQLNYRTLFCKYNEPLYIKCKKVHLLPSVTCQDNLSEVLEELTMYCSDVTPSLSEDAVKAIGEIAFLFPNQFDQCVKKLLELLHLNVEYVTSGVLKVLPSLECKENVYIKEILHYLPHCIHLVTDDSGKCAIMWLIGEYGQHLPESPYLLELYIKQFNEEASVEVQLHLLTAGMKLLLERPSECQEMVGQLLEYCLESCNVDLHDKAVMYYNLLNHDVNLAHKMVLSDKKCSAE